MSIEANIARGATATKSGIIVGGHATYCQLCNSVMSSDGCSNIYCQAARPTSDLGRCLHIAAQTGMPLSLRG